MLLNGTRIGTSAFTYHNATPGSFKVLIQKGGYEDYTGSVTVVEGKRTRILCRAHATRWLDPGGDSNADVDRHHDPEVHAESPDHVAKHHTH